MVELLGLGLAGLAGVGVTFLFLRLLVGKPKKIRAEDFGEWIWFPD